MSDFLRHIVQRHATGSAGVRPRATSRFEQPAVFNAPGSEPAPPSGVEPASMARGAGVNERSVPLGEPLRARGVGARDVSARDDGTRGAPVGDRDGYERRARSIASELSALSAGAGEESADPSSSTNPWTPSAIRGARARDGADRRGDEDADEQHDPVVPQPRLVRPTNRAPNAAPVVPRRDGTQGATSQGATTQREPDVVRVHIGRVEVRAIIAPPPERQRSSPAAPSAPDASRALSLEKYLADKGRL